MKSPSPSGTHLPPALGCVRGGGCRDDSIETLRRVLTPMLDGDQSMCRIAAERGIFCRGFRRWSASDFDRRWRGAIGRSTHLSREQMERFADLWLLTEQISSGFPLACDTRRDGNGPCSGWDEFSDGDLTRFCRELGGEFRPDAPPVLNGNVPPEPGENPDSPTLPRQKLMQSHHSPRSESPLGCRQRSEIATASRSEFNGRTSWKGLKETGCFS